MQVKSVRPDVKVRFLGVTTFHVAMELLQRWRMRLLCHHIQTKGGYRPTTGLMATFFMTKHCKKVSSPPLLMPLRQPSPLPVGLFPAQNTCTSVSSCVS